MCTYVYSMHVCLGFRRRKTELRRQSERHHLPGEWLHFTHECKSVKVHTRDTYHGESQMACIFS